MRVLNAALCVHAACVEVARGVCTALHMLSVAMWIGDCGDRDLFALSQITLGLIAEEPEPFIFRIFSRRIVCAPEELCM